MDIELFLLQIFLEWMANDFEYIEVLDIIFALL